jgi:galactonate dehydratase
MPDLIWTGGITEGQKIAILADSFHLPIAPHDCTGLVTLFANMHLCAASPNAMILETVRGFYDGGWYQEAYSDGIQIESGKACIPHRPGLGVRLRDSLLQDAGVEARVSRR